ncbi:cupin domain-containing protein [Rhizobium sp. NRK18]|uniref:cupin domain-containing protein n=1 Tax=Rhizobium sp. NRK18 TaxID=2964667 RepID=UPI0021C42E88|nr:cupin domain-containing protein [Rhizobium sp. NRK18]MCQ2003059.1 cupin domain-containing protein [Rhizobium sp. NRK18]
MTADEIIQKLSLQPHPEGGWYAETFRDTAGAPRGHSTAIYYMLQKGEKSHWHRVRDAVEIWHYYAGAPLALHRSSDGLISDTVTLGTNLAAGEHPQAIVHSGWWQSAETLGDYTLVGCTVAPGFEFSSFEMAPSDWNPLDR